MINILFCSVGRRGRLIQDFKKSLKNNIRIVATDNLNTAPALYFADKQYVVPKITDKNYLSIILDICKKENISAITTFIDPEIELLSRNRDIFIQNGILPLCPSKKTANICFDKYLMFEYLKKNNVNTILSFIEFEKFMEAYNNNEIGFPVFIKPRTGSGSVGAVKVNSMEDLIGILNKNEENYIIQEFMSGLDINCDVYVDCISSKPVSIFCKKKLETRIGGASKTISFKDEKLFEFIKKILSIFEFYGPIDIDFFEKNGEYYLSEINPRFGGSYLHAFGAGINFIELIENNINNIVNIENIGDYEEDVLMMMYDDVVIKKKSELAL